jgi:hypothetical protein
VRGAKNARIGCFVQAEDTTIAAAAATATLRAVDNTLLLRSLLLQVFACYPTTNCTTLCRMTVRQCVPLVLLLQSQLAVR